MESIYWVMAWACHRRCRHCYEDRFRPYVRAELERVVAEAERNTPRVLANLPARMTYLDTDDPNPDGTLPEKAGRIILSGGEALLDPVRTRVTYRVIAGIVARYRDAGGVKLVVQTTGDLLTPEIVRDLLGRGVRSRRAAGGEVIARPGAARRCALRQGCRLPGDALSDQPDGPAAARAARHAGDGNAARAASRRGVRAVSDHALRHVRAWAHRFAALVRYARERRQMAEASAESG